MATLNTVDLSFTIKAGMSQTLMEVIHSDIDSFEADYAKPLQ